MAGSPPGSRGTLTLLGETEAAAAVASLDLASLDQRFRSLLLVATLRGDTVAEQIETRLRFNGDATAVYNTELGSANAASLTAAEVLGATQARIANAVAASALASMFGGLVAFVPDYTETDRFKTVFSLGGSPVTNATTKTLVHWTFSVWRSTAAVSQVTLLPNAGNYDAGSRLAIYGL